MAKLSDKEFWDILRRNAGLYSRTVRAIKKEFGIDITRQSVRERALKDPEQLADIEEENIDFAEEGLHGLMRSKNEKIKLESIKTFIQAKGKKRGYNPKVDMAMELTVKKKPSWMEDEPDAEAEES